VNYKSRLQDQDAFDDEAAKQQLSQYGYHKLFPVEYKTSRRLQFVVHENDTIVWPHGSPQNCDEHVLIRGGQRCSRERQLAFNHQCCRHELCCDGKLDLSKYSTRWLNRKTFNSTIFSFNQQIPQAEPQTTFGEDGGLSENDGPCFPQGVAADNLSKADPEDEATLSELAANGPTPRCEKITYQFAVEKATNLVRLAQSDQVILGLLCSLLDQLARRLRNSQSIEVQSYNTAVPSGQESPGSAPVLGTLKAAPNTYQERRKISRHETRRQIVRQKRTSMLSLIGQSNDLECLPEPHAKGKTCSICRCAKHQRGSCPKIHKYKKPSSVINKDMMSRHELSTTLKQVSRYKTRYRPTTDTRKISRTLPKTMAGVVIHHRFFVHPNTTSRMCLECTILDQKGDAHSRFQNFLFITKCISVYVPRSKTNIVICELEDAATSRNLVFLAEADLPKEQLGQFIRSPRNTLMKVESDSGANGSSGLGKRRSSFAND
jgi:hypothetical protein